MMFEIPTISLVLGERFLSFAYKVCPYSAIRKEMSSGGTLPIARASSVILRDLPLGGSCCFGAFFLLI
jgi:hypothetical protein